LQYSRTAGEPDLTQALISRLLDELWRCSPTTSRFSACEPPQAASLLFRRLLAELRLMRLAAMIVTFYDSRSPKSGAAAAASAVGVPQGSIAELSATAKRIFAASYTSALTLPTDFVSFFLEILLLPTARVPSRTSSRGLKWSISPYIRAYPADNCCLGAPAWRDRLSWAPYFGIGLAPSPSHRVGPAPAPECSTGLRQVSQAGPVVDKVEPDISAHYLLS